MKTVGYILLGVLGFSSMACADAPAVTLPVGHYPELNLIHYQINAEQWVTTQTALVTIGIDASLNQSGMDNLQTQINQSLASLAKDISWQMTDYERNQDSSGLESIHIEEQARLTADQLTQLRTHTEALSKPGIHYSVLNIAFTPSLADIEQAENNLRETLNQKIADEIKRVDKQYDQTFYIHDLTFYSGDQPVPQPAQANYKMLNMVAAAPQSTASMSQRLVLHADVILAAVLKPE